MDPDEYRTVSFDQSTRLHSGKQRRDQLLDDVHTSNDAFERALKEKEAVEKTGGLCEALALKWLKVKFKENNGAGRQNAASRLAVIDRDKTFDRAFSRYAATNAAKYGGISLGGDQRFGLEDYYGLQALDDPAVSTQTLPTGKTSVNITSYVARTVANSKHGFFLHSIRCPKFADGYHALAYYTSSGKVANIAKHVYMFDPDYGEYKVPPSKFITWMPKFVNFFYGAGEGDSRWLKTMSLGNKRATP
jgi:hypothetical protein